MRHRIGLLLIVLGILTGCAATSDPWQMRLMNRERLMHLSVGMSREQVLEVMGTETVPGSLQDINNPFRYEILKTENGVFTELFFYYTDAKGLDSAITDDELTPLVLEDGKLVGWGWHYLGTDCMTTEVRAR